MPTSDFDEFVERKTKQADTSPPIDWATRREEWLQDVEALYTSVEEYLASYIRDGKISISRELISLNEERLGSYTTKKLILRIGVDVVEFLPVGAIIFGAWGRVDMIGPSGRIRLVLVERKAKNVRLKVTILDANAPRVPDVRPPREERAWKIAGSSPEMTLTELHAETLRDAIVEVANG